MTAGKTSFGEDVFGVKLVRCKAYPAATSFKLVHLLVYWKGVSGNMLQQCIVKRREQRSPLLFPDNDNLIMM